MSGYASVDRLVSEMAPPRVNRIASTQAKTGRSMKNCGMERI